MPSIVHDVLRAPGAPLDADTRAFMEPRFGHDFSRVRVHTDSRAAESARAVGALAYTVGRDVVFGAGRYAPGSGEGRGLIAHELTHVVQQSGVAGPLQPQVPVVEGGGGGYRISVAPEIEDGPAHLEAQAERNARLFASGGDTSPHAMAGAQPVAAGVERRFIQRARVPLPRPVPLCGRTLTHIDVEPPRWRPLAHCLPPTVLVNRINIVGREVSSRTTGRGRIIFNLHVGYYRDPATGRLCAIVDDSKACITGSCMHLGCFPTLKEVIDAILDFLKDALKVIGIIVLLIILALIGRGLLRPGRGPAPSPFPAPVPIATGSAEEDGAGTGDTVEV